ncbi:MAG: hypothetical protein IPJ88_01860 [Myxococcales bacterium]|nr:MAG: hypothetical protein IPJ88_01860 [Myxococcales bacterium]
MMRVLIVLCLFFSVTAHAQSSVQDKKAARLLYQQAQHRAAQGDYEQALSLLDEALLNIPLREFYMP